MTTYILVDPNDDTGNDDGILDKIEMTKDEAEKRNAANRKDGCDLRWIKNAPSKIYTEQYYE